MNTAIHTDGRLILLSSIRVRVPAGPVRHGLALIFVRNAEDKQFELWADRRGVCENAEHLTPLEP